ncbi:ketopantoate reductase family protein [Streptomyces sp. NRRL B-24720]|uniref:ketopantoate reductase family protein n=1 Tax=Streptomyces sp. NRRL B-24720 TaxID=1476876 RepID=UPI0004C98D90|nr:2-dehydropantoate 2-reductase [Streptomyces sp. NRRL B-24720]
MRIAVIGAGGVGGYFGARLAAAGYEVTFVARGRHLEAIRRSGLRVRSPLGEFRTSPSSAVASIADIDFADLVVVAVKLWDTEGVAAQLHSLADKGASVLSLQNGVQKDAILRGHLPDASVLGGVSFISAFIEEPGVIVHNGTLQRLVFGPYLPVQMPILQSLLTACRAAGIEAEVRDDIEKAIWEKFVFLVGLSASTATIRQPIGVIRAVEGSRTLLHDLMAETVTLAQRSGVSLIDGFADEQLEFCDTLPPEMTSSMYNDLERGNRLELPWLSGGVVDLAAGASVPVPRNQAVADIVAPYVLGAPPRVA